MTTNTSKTPVVKCPTCQTNVEWSEKFPHRPFCSERCKLIDFGEWAEEKNRIAGSSAYDDLMGDDLTD